MASLPAGPSKGGRGSGNTVDQGLMASMRRLAPRGAVAGLLVGLVLAVLTPADPASAPSWGGDYPAFHTAGRIVLAGDGARLYEPMLQRQVQGDLPVDGFLSFLYPPFVAALYAPLALLDMKLAFLVATAVALASLAGAVRLLSPVSPWIRRDAIGAFAAALFFYPMMRSVLGGQNTAITLLLLAATASLLRARRELAAGAVLGLLAYKPQFLLPVAWALLAAGHRLFVLGVAATGLALYAAGALVTGPDWPLVWVRAAGVYNDLDRVASAAKSVSLSQFTEIAAWPKGWVVLSAGLGLWLGWHASRRGRDDVDGLVAIAAVATLLIAPHAIYYDVGLALPGMLLLAERGRPGVAAALWIAGFAQVVLPLPGVSPLAFLLLALLVLLARPQGPDGEA